MALEGDLHTRMILASAHPDERALFLKEVAQLAQTYSPTHAMVMEAFNIGDATVFDALLSSPRLHALARRELATRALFYWNANPLLYGSCARILSVLLKHGADANLPTEIGESVADRLGIRLGTIEGNEQRALESGFLKKSTHAYHVLLECWNSMEKAHVDLSEARRLRMIAMEPSISRAKKQTK